MKKSLKILLAAALLVMGLVPTVVLAEEQTINLVDGGEPEAEVIVNANIGNRDNTIYNPDLPVGDERWINVTLPTIVFFQSDFDGDLEDIVSPVYYIRNNSYMGIAITVDNFVNTSNAGSMAYIAELNIFDRANGGLSVQLMEDGAIDIAADNLFVRMPGNAGTEGDYEPSLMSFGFNGELTEIPVELIAQPTFLLTLTFESINRDGTPVVDTGAGDGSEL